eukprot:Nitzschia sp. Nitz4//NODE_202_length_38933_cov_72.610268//20707//21996//NITZ4_additional_000023-RA//-1//CDS//3329531789//2630//frame0
MKTMNHWTWFSLFVLAFSLVGGEVSAEEEVVDTFDAASHTDWGTYYDPKNIFCGRYDCYKILGFDYENYGKEKPTTRTITKRYRALSRAWHPDKSQHKDAKERFVKIARAYEVLTDVQQRKEYDSMRYDQEAYFKKYGSDVLFNYAPKTDMFLVIFLLLGGATWFSWVAQEQKWKQVANRLVQAAVEDWTPAQGGTPESKQLREQALAKLKETEGETAPEGGKQKKSKVLAKEKKKLEQEKLQPIIEGLVQEIEDFGAGFHKPTWKDLLIVKMAQWPMHVGSEIAWQTMYWIRRLQKLELNDNERAVLTERAVGRVTWELASAEEREALTHRELWVLDNLREFKEEQEMKQLSRSDQRMINKMKKKSSKSD